MKSFLYSIDQQEVFSYYFEEPIYLSKKYRNPIRQDKSASCYFRWKNDRLYFYDLADSKQWDCISFVKDLYQLNSMGEACDKISVDITTEKKFDTIKIEQNIKKQSEVKIVVDIQDFNEKDLKYWNDYSISIEELKLYKIYSVKNFYINGYIQSKDELCFAYYFSEGKWKIYQPLTKTWRTNVSTFIEEPLEYDDNLDYIIITKSRKDRIVLSKFFKNVFNCQSENALSIPYEFDERFHYKKRICFFDNDAAGKKACFNDNYEHNLIKRGYLPVFIDDFLYLSRGITDASDYIKTFNLEKARNYLMKKINEIRCK